MKSCLKRVKAYNNGETHYNVYDSSGQLAHTERHLANGQVHTKTDYRAAGMRISRFLKIYDHLGDLAGYNTVYYHSDHLGSPVLATNVNGTERWRESYTPFGETLTSPADNDNQAGFTGHIKDSATGLTYMQARYHDPVMGRFLSIDPVTFMDTGNPVHFNRYAYANNNPINLIDPDGRKATGYFSPSNGSFFIRDNDTGASAFSSNFFTGQPNLTSSQTNGPIPSGSFSILSRTGEMAGAPAFRLEPNDSNFGDDATDSGRTNIRLHQGTVSLGCVTCRVNSEYAKVLGVLNNTSTSETDVDRKGLLGKFGVQESLSDFGTLNVLDENSTINFNSDTGAAFIRTQESDRTVYNEICTMSAEGGCQ